jgi:hypothetical protein
MKPERLQFHNRSEHIFDWLSYGRGAGVGRTRGAGVALGISVAVGVALGAVVGVAVAVGVVVAVAIAVAVGVGVGSLPACASNEPTSMRPLRTRQKSGPR